MATAAQVKQFRQAQSNVSLLAERDLRRFFDALDKQDAMAVVRALELFMPDLIQKYGEIGASVAADFYDELRASSGTRKAYRAVMGDVIPFEQARISTKWAVGPMFQKESDAGATLSNLIDVSDRLVKQQGRNTIHTNAQRDPSKVRYARVPTGAETCTFCLMLASRGAVYANSESAGGSNEYHGKCDCQPVPIWNDGDYDTLKSTGYDPDRLFERWQDSQKSK